MALFKHKIKMASKDYLPSMLPSTRRELFWDILKLHYGKFFIYGALILLFSLPIHAIALLEDSNVLQITNAMQNATEEQRLAGTQMIAQLRVLFAVVKIPFLLIFSLALAGFARVIRQYAWGENVFFWSDFIKGIRGNSAHFLILFLLGGILNAVAVYFSESAAFETSFVVQVIKSIPMMAMIFIVVPIFAYATVISTVYSTSIFKVFAVSATIYMRSPVRTALVLLACLAPFALNIMPILFLHIVGRLICTFLVPLVFLVWYLFCFSQLDKYVNKDQHPELLGRGLYIPE